MLFFVGPGAAAKLPQMTSPLAGATPEIHHMCP